jgi:alpha-1,2-mannosyltransferase
MMTTVRKRVAIVAAVAVVVGVFDAIVAMRHGFFDLNVYFGAINHWADGGQLYDFLRPRTEYGFTYPPFAALTMLPMVLIPWHVAIAIHGALTLGATFAVLYWLVDPIVQRRGWPRWFTFAIALCLIAAYEPMRETFFFGQVNMLLLGLVLADAVLLLGRGSRWAGLGIGLATAIKLTPGLFIVYLLITRRWRAAAVASATAVGATLLAAGVMPLESRIFWTEALWNTDRIGVLSFVSNQSLQGVLARLDPSNPNRLVWLGCALAALAVWAWRVRRAVAAGDELAGIALTGVAICLVSPVTWIHHLVWLVPALVLLVDSGLRATGRRRRWLLAAAITAYVVLCSSVVWLWRWNLTGLDEFLGANLYVWISLALLVGLPLQPDRVADLGEVDRHAAGTLDAEGRPFPVRG